MTSSPTLLCIDDSKLVQSLISRELEDYDVRLHFANDGFEGLDSSLRFMPDLVMLDLRMPGMDGIEFLKRWKMELGFMETRFIIMTSETSRHVVEEVLRFGISDYIAKPFSGSTILARIGQHIPLKKQALSARPPQNQRLFPVQAVNAPQKADNLKPVLATPSGVTLQSIRVLTQKIEGESREASEEEHSLHEIISKYQVLLGSRNAYLTSVLVELLKDGKVRVESDKFTERMQLKHSENKIDAATAGSLLARFFEEQRRNHKMDSGTTQRIVLQRPASKKRPAN